jgi:hypothetical protein
VAAIAAALLETDSQTGRPGFGGVEDTRLLLIG